VKALNLRLSTFAADIVGVANAYTTAMRANGHGCSRIREFGALRASTLRWVQADTQTLTRLFQLPVRYVIPLYQRPYVWSEERQWVPLWKDIAAVADRFLLLGAADTKPPSHFLGAIVVEQQHSPPGAPPQVLITDKQQRLTTLQLLSPRPPRARRRWAALPTRSSSPETIFLRAVLLRSAARYASPTTPNIAPGSSHQTARNQRREP